MDVSIDKLLSSESYEEPLSLLIDSEDPIVQSLDDGSVEEPLSLLIDSEEPVVQSLDDHSTSIDEPLTMSICDSKLLSSINDSIEVIEEYQNDIQICNKDNDVEPPLATSTPCKKQRRSEDVDGSSDLFILPNSSGEHIASSIENLDVSLLTSNESHQPQTRLTVLETTPRPSGISKTVPGVTQECESTNNINEEHGETLQHDMSRPESEHMYKDWRQNTIIFGPEIVSLTLPLVFFVIAEYIVSTDSPWSR
ncbi:hypothetical protein AC249_AIPGENE21495 [Exaiptasia diaphana]|nr:hypothetical protein AC249_AIPGENE21495 [Exaiptasia diaphana]